MCGGALGAPYNDFILFVFCYEMHLLVNFKSLKFVVCNMQIVMQTDLQTNSKVIIKIYQFPYNIYERTASVSNVLSVGVVSC